MAAIRDIDSVDVEMSAPILAVAIVIAIVIFLIILNQVGPHGPRASFT